MEKKKGTNVLLAIMGVLIIAMLMDTILTLNSDLIAVGCVLVSLIMVALYGFWLYKKPHGNILKIAMLIFSISNIISCMNYINIGYTEPCYLYPYAIRTIVSALICYCAGRLDRIDQNKIFFPIFDMIFFVLGVYWAVIFMGVVPTVYLVRFFSGFIIFTTIMIAYFVRYKEHKEAGLEDAKNK